MKKIFTLLFALVIFSALFAQRNTTNNHSFNDWSTPADNRRCNDNIDYYNDRSNHAVVVTNDNHNQQYDRRYNDNNSRAEMDRINQDYDRRINDYRNNRRLNAYQRERQVEILQRERNERLKSFGGGVLVGGILGILLGSHL